MPDTPDSPGNPVPDPTGQNLAATAGTAGKPRVVVVADGFGDLPALQAAAAVAAGWSAAAPQVQIHAFGSHAGGAGFADLVARAKAESLGPEAVTTRPVVVSGPDGTQVPAEIVLATGAAGRTAYLDTAQVAGRHLVDTSRLADPAGLNSAGIGELLALARQAGAERIVTGVGPLAPHDGGVGMLRTLGAQEDLSRLAQVRSEWEGSTLLLAATGREPLLGFHGASASLAEYGVAPGVTQRLESQLGLLSDRVSQLLPQRTDLLTNEPHRPERAAAAGAGGGVGYALQLLGATTSTAPVLLLSELGIDRFLPASLLVLVTDCYDHHTVHAGVVADTALAALATATPSVVLARELAVGRREGMSLGVSGSYAPRPPAASISPESSPSRDLAALAARVARTWTPG